MKSYRELLVWQKAMDLVAESYRVAGSLPRSETYGLKSQIQRAAVSIPANIAEGHGREHLGDYLHHLSIASGSVAELETHFLVAERLSLLAKDEITRALGGFGRGWQNAGGAHQKPPAESADTWHLTPST